MFVELLFLAMPRLGGCLGDEGLFAGLPTCMVPLPIIFGVEGVFGDRMPVGLCVSVAKTCKLELSKDANRSED